jgi:meiotically up-regulated gene 157 (Mug157) protein/endonuclease/exonuclease/phosphatase family metal-dependent hydrolase
MTGNALAQTAGLHIASFNVRYANNSDVRAGNAWKDRCPEIVSLIRLYDMDVIGTQEGLESQINDLQNALSDYAYIGVGRGDGIAADEFAAIFYKTERFRLLRSDNFWLSTTPNKPSKSWDAALNRICTWGEFEEKDSGFRFFVFNLHFDHAGETARQNSAELVVNTIQRIAKNAPVVLTGDFNADQSSKSYQIITASDLLQDVFEIAPTVYAPNGTFNSFSLTHTSKQRIDHIFVSKHFSAVNYGVLTNIYWKDQTPRFPSDHFPILTDLHYKMPFILPADNAKVYTSNRPEKAKRLFVSQAVEEKIAAVKKVLTHAKLAWMFENCFPNTLDTTVEYKPINGEDDTFVITGDIHAMWLRDSGAQVYPYVPLAKHDEALKKMLRGVILRQLKCILIDPYANAFNYEATGSEWQSDRTKMKPELHERKWEIDSLCYVIRLAYYYWQQTGDASVFGKDWENAIRLILKTFKEQQKKNGWGPYTFARKTDRQFDTMSNDGKGNPVKPVGLIASAFRPSDDATIYQFLVPSNFFAVSSLRKSAEILTKVNHRDDLAQQCSALADEVYDALQQYATYNHPKYGTIYAYEVDGFGNRLLSDDSNVPSLLAMAYLGDVAINDPIYQNTRRFVWSEDNPYFFKGKAGEGIGGPHIGFDMIWHMSIMMKAFTAQDDDEIKACMQMLIDTDADTGFMHESFHKDNPAKFTRKWFAWQNTLFGELVIKLVDEGKTDLLNSLR